MKKLISTLLFLCLPLGAPAATECAHLQKTLRQWSTAKTASEVFAGDREWMSYALKEILAEVKEPLPHFTYSQLDLCHGQLKAGGETFDFKYDDQSETLTMNGRRFKVDQWISLLEVVYASPSSGSALWRALLPPASAKEQIDEALLEKFADEIKTHGKTMRSWRHALGATVAEGVAYEKAKKRNPQGDCYIPESQPSTVTVNDDADGFFHCSNVLERFFEMLVSQCSWDAQYGQVEVRGAGDNPMDRRGKGHAFRGVTGSCSCRFGESTRQVPVSKEAFGRRVVQWNYPKCGDPFAPPAWNRSKKKKSRAPASDDQP